MDCEFIHDVETWGSGGEMMDVVVLKDGRILVIAADRIAIYESRAAFDRGDSRHVVDVASLREDSQGRQDLLPASRHGS